MKRKKIVKKEVSEFNTSSMSKPQKFFIIKLLKIIDFVKYMIF